jgi:hypothetical protein
VRLEVIEQNKPARKLYGKLGFVHERDLGAWTLGTAPPRMTSAQPARFGDAHAWIVANRVQPEPWQRADETVAHLCERGVEIEGMTFERDGEIAGALLYQHGQGVPSATQFAARDEQAAAHLLTALASLGDGLRLVNLPAGDPAEAALRLLRARCDVLQHELRVTL